LSGEGLIDAIAAAGDLEDEPAWLIRRARHLLDGELSDFRALFSLHEALSAAGGLALLGSFLIGGLANYLGPGGRIHVLYNPIFLLVTWNLALLAALFLRRLWLGPAAEALRAARAGADPAVPTRPRPSGGGRRPLRRWLIRRALPSLLLRVHRAGEEGAASARELASVGRAFWSLWIGVQGEVLELRLRRALHLGAIGLLLGAVLGMFVRGVFFEYDVIWRSTFLREPETVGRLLALFLGPAALLAGQPVPDTRDAAALMSEAGLPAARWIWLYAISAGLFALIPRAVLWALATLRLDGLQRRIVLDLDDAYFRNVLEGPRALQIGRIEVAIRDDVRDACDALALRLSEFACERLYDARVVPILEQFRQSGGKLAEVEASIECACRAFQRELDACVPETLGELERTLAEGLEQRIGAALAPGALGTTQLSEQVGSQSTGAARRAGASVSYRLSDSLAVVVSGAVAAGTGTLAGGFGKWLGIAVVTLLLGTTGPIGFLIGAVAGIAMAGAGWWAARERVTESIREASLPGLAVRAVLWRGRFDQLISEGRERCRNAVHQALKPELDALAPRMAERIWRELKPALGERLRTQQP
jgi:hypothetical protein